jgi:HK97 family phage portal protein
MKLLETLGFRDTRQDLDTRIDSSARHVRSLGDTVAPGWSGKPTWPVDSIPVLTTQGYRKCVTAFACINIIAAAVAETKATLRVYQDQGEGKRDELLDHPVRALMQRPNPTKSEGEFLSLMVRLAAISGFCAVEKVRSQAGRVVELWHLRSDRIKPVLHDQAPPSWQYTVPGHPQSPFTIPAEDVALFTYMDDVDLSITGDTPLRAILREAGILHSLTDFIKLLLERGGIPPFVLVVDTPTPTSDNGISQPRAALSPEEVEYIREQMRQRYGGYQNWTGPAVLEGARIERVGLDLNELAHKDLRDVIDLSVCSAFRVPPILVQVLAGIETSYGLAFEQSMRALQLYTAEPLRDRIDGALSRSLLPEIDPRPNVSLEFDTSRVEALQENADAVHNRARADFTAGGMTLNDFRRRIGEDAIGGDLGNSLFLPFSVVPTLATGGALPSEEGRSGVRAIASRTAGPEQTRAAIGASNKATIVRLGNRYAPPLRAFWKSQGQRIVEAAKRSARESIIHRNADGRPFVVGFGNAPTHAESRAMEDIDWEDELRLLSETLVKLHSGVGAAAWQAASAQLGIELDWSLANPNVRSVLNQLAGQIKAIDATTRTDVQRIVGESLDEGVTLDELADRLTGLFEESYHGRALTVARSESQIAFNLASAAGYKETGQVAEVLLYDNPDHGDYDGDEDGLTCQQRDGMVVALDQVSVHANGTHPNCSLSIAPILAKPLGEE